MPAKHSYISAAIAEPDLLPHWLPLGRLTLPGEAKQVRQARRFVTGVVTENHRQHNTALLLTSELVTNAVRHSKSGQPGGILELTVAATCSALLISVTDQGPVAGLPVVGTAPGGTSGNGLVLVDRLSDGWGYRHDAGRTTVWFRLRAVGPPALPPARPSLAAAARA